MLLTEFVTSHNLHNLRLNRVLPITVRWCSLKKKFMARVILRENATKIILKLSVKESKSQLKGPFNMVSSD